MAEETICSFDAVDWGSQQHQACVLDAAGKIIGERAFPHGGAGLAALCGWLVSMADDPGSVAVAIEVPHGPVVDALLDRGFAVHAINPKQLDRLRDRFSVAGAKDDRRDARVAAAGLRTDRPLFRPVAASPRVAAPCPVGGRSPEPISCRCGIPSAPASSSMIRHRIVSPPHNPQPWT